MSVIETEGPTKSYLTAREVSELLQVAERTVQRLAARDSSFPATRVGPKLLRVERAALERWLAARTQRKRSSP